MKHLRSYKIFEDSEEEDENDIIPEGFKYSWNDIYESLLYLTDIGFKIDSEKRYLADSKGQEIEGKWEYNYGERNYRSNIEMAKNAIYEIRLSKKKESGRIRKEVSLGGYPSREKTYYLDNNINELLSIYEEIASFCSRFDKSYHNLSIESDGYSVWLVASSEVTGDFINKKLDDELNARVLSIIEKRVSTALSRFSSSSRAYTKKFREDFLDRSLVSIKDGIAIQLFNWGSISKSVYNTNSELFEKAISLVLNNLNSDKYGYKAEFRELKESDIVDIKKEWQIEKLKAYIGKKAVIVKFDYDKVFNKVKKEESKK